VVVDLSIQIAVLINHIVICGLPDSAVFIMSQRA